jgi:DNA primase catalytic core
MSLHKLTAGDGYTYLTRQVAAADATDKGHTGLGDYYTQKGESPGVWVGSGLSGLDGVDAGQRVSAEQMKALFGEGRHPNADRIGAAMIDAGASPAAAERASALGHRFYIYDQAPPFRVEVAKRFVEHNASIEARWDAPIPPAMRARIRTDVGTEMLTAALGRPPADARELSGFIAKSSRQATTAVAGYDLTFSPVKSVSALWALASSQVATQIEEAHQAAVADTLGWLEREATYTRAGTDGVRQIEVAGLVGTAFTHRDARSGDPDLHTHVAISNKVQALDGRWLALDGRVLFKANVAASERYNTRIEAELGARLGVSFEARSLPNTSKRPIREVVGVHPRLNSFWSSRRADIEGRGAELSAAFQVDHGRPPMPIESLHLAQQATLETREDKHSPRSYAEQRATWSAQAKRVLGGSAAVEAMIAAATGGRQHGHTVTEQTVAEKTVTEQWVAGTASQVLTTVSGARSTWQMWHVRAEAERRARNAGVALLDLDGAVDRVVACALSPAHSVSLVSPELVAEPAILRRRDGSSVYTVAGAALFTSQAVMDAEARLVAAALLTDGPAVPAEVVQVALLESAANGVTLNPAQAQLVREMATSGARLQLAIAPAGSGKTTAMAVLARAWTDGGGTVIGLAPSAVAASVLREQIGSRTDTLAKLTWSLTRDPMPQWVRNIDSKTLVVIDEAGMAGTTDLAAAVDYITGKGGAVRLVGDDQQLASVAAGGVLRDIAETAGAVTLSELIRFKDPAEGAASLALRTGDDAGIGFYLDNGRVHVGDLSTATDAAYRAWSTDRGGGLDSIMLAPTRDLVAVLNSRARADRLLAESPAVGREVTLADGNRASAGDTIITRANERRLVISASDWVKNGDRWTVTKVHRGGALDVQHLGTARHVTLPAAYVAVSAQLGYAATVHGAQGVTTDTCHSVATGDESRQLFYVAMTRGRTGNDVYLVTAGNGDPHSVIKPETVRPPTATDILAGILARDDRPLSASTLTSEQACPTTQLRDAVARYYDSLGVIAETVVGAEVMTRLDTAAEELHPGLTASPAYPTLRAHLAIVGADGHDPVSELAAALNRRELGTAGDPAAVLDWRLDPTGGRRSSRGPLPWIPGIPASLNANERYGPYLTARADLIRALVEDVRTQATQLTPTTVPPWAVHLMDPAHEQLLGDLTVWRAATGVPILDRRPTGAPQFAAPAARAQHDLDVRTVAVQGDPRAPVREWTPLAIRLGLDFDHDPYWPELADRLSSLSRAGLEVSGMVMAAAAEKPLPDDQGAAALWWRLSRHLSPAAVTATHNSGATTLRPSWSQELVASLGEPRAARVMADPAWPTLVAAVNGAVGSGWAPLQLLTDIDAGYGQPLPASDLAEALVWRVAALTDPAPLHGLEPPPDPAEEGAPEDLHLLEVHDRDPYRYATVDPNGSLPGSNNEPSLETTAPEVESYDEAIFHAARHREYAPAPDLDAFDTERQLVEANRWDHASVPRERLLELNEIAADFFTAGYPDSWGPQYVVGRLGTDLADHPTFRPGYAPAGWTNLTDHLRRLGVSDYEILAAGLGRVASTGRIIDQFRDRIVLPIRNRDQIHGFIGRRNPTLADDRTAGPKYLNTPATDLFDKSAQLFGLSEGQAALDAGATPVLVEGFFDALAITLAGHGQYVGVAPLGTSFTDAQANQLRPFIGADRFGVTVATDADLPGEIAAQRAFWMLTARGDTPRHVAMWGGQDPAEVFEHTGPTALKACLNYAQPLAKHLLDERLNHLGEELQVLPECAAVIAAQPPHTWVEQIDYVTTRTNPGYGIVQQAVTDAAQRWTLNPLGEAQSQVSNLATVRARLQRAAQAPLSDDGQANLVSTAADAETQRLHGGQSGKPNSNGATAAAGTTTQQLPPIEAWRQLAHTIDSRLTAGDDWPILARAIQEADAAGCNVAGELPQLANGGQLWTEHPATELAYVLRAKTQTTSDIEPSRGPDRNQAAAHSQVNTRPARRDPGRKLR